MNEMYGAEAFVRMLQLFGVKHIFGLCGDTSLPLYDALYRLGHGVPPYPDDRFHPDRARRHGRGQRERSAASAVSIVNLAAHRLPSCSAATVELVSR